MNVVKTSVRGSVVLSMGAVSCLVRRRSVVLKTAVIDCVLVELCGDLPAVMTVSFLISA